jgi:YgiT-type zinc finger domain-containing protein
MKKAIRCTECGAKMEAKEVSQEFEREGVRVCIDGIPALVCPKCGDVSFAPGIAQKIVEAASSLFEIAFLKRRGRVATSMTTVAEARK